MSETIHYDNQPSWLSFTGLLVLAVVILFLSISINLSDAGAEVVFQGISNPVGVKEQVRSIKGLP